MADDRHKPAGSPPDPLDSFRQTAEQHAQDAIHWYWKAKEWKRYPSQWIQFVALFLTAAAGIAPIVIQLFKGAGKLQSFDSGPLASLFVGLAAALLGLDKAFGYSSGWIRYVLTATSMTKRLREFQMAWRASMAAAANPPTPEQRAAIIQLAADFESAMQAMVLDETKDWASEFRSNMAQMEKDVKAQLDALKTRLEQSARDAQAASKPAALEVTVQNAAKSDGFAFDIALDGPSGRIVDSVANAIVWTAINRAPGQYQVKVTAKVQGAALSASSVVDLKPGEIAKASLTLPIG